MLTRVQCPCGFIASAQSIRAASYAVETHALYAHQTGMSIGIVLNKVTLLDRKP